MMPSNSFLQKKGLLFVLLSIFFTLFHFQSNVFAASTNETWPMNYDNCIKNAKSALNTNNITANSILRACKEVTDSYPNYQGAVWIDEFTGADYGGNTTVSSQGNISDTSVKRLVLHGNAVFNGNNSSDNKTLARKIIATNIHFYYCSNNAAQSDSCNNQLEIPVKTTNVINEFPASGYIGYPGWNEYNNTCIQIDTWSNSTRAEWSAFQNKNGCKNGYYTTGLTLYRGLKSKNKNWSTGGWKTILLNNTNLTQYLKDNGRISNSATTYKIWIYRCMTLMSSNESSFINHGTYTVGACGYDSTGLSFTVPNPSTEEVTMESGAKINDESSFTYNSPNRTFETTDETTTVHFNHRVTSSKAPSTISYYKNDSGPGITHTKSTSSSNGKAIVSLSPNEESTVCEHVQYSPTLYIGDIAQNNSGTTLEACITIRRLASADLSVSAKVSATTGGSTKTAETTADKNNTSSLETASEKIVLNNTLSASSEHKISRSGSDEAFPRSINWSYSFDGTTELKDFLPPTNSGNLSKSYTNADIPLGTRLYTISASTSVGGSTAVDGTLSGSALSATAQIEVENPWNFDLTPTVSSDTTSSSYAGSGATASFMVSSERKDESIRATIPPDGAILQYAQIILDGNIESQNAENLDLKGGDTINNISTFNICQFFKNRLSTAVKSECREEPRKYYADEQDGWNINETFSDTFLNSAEVGDKICYAVAVNYVDSGYDNEYGIDYKYVVPATANQRTLSRWRNHWRISNLSCGTTSKRPHFEVWGGSVYSAGKVAGTTMRFYNPANPNDWQTFGSWIDFGIIAKNEVEKVASGAAYAQGATWDPNPCDYSPLTITNTVCNNLGNSRINMSSKTLEKLYKEFTPQPNGASSADQANLDSDYSSYETRAFSKPDQNGKYRYTYSNGDLVINPGGPSTPLPHGTTHIIYAKGDITIENDLSYGDDAYYGKSTDVPQYLIISDGDINITGNVARIDAWLIARQGIVDTCDGYDVGGGGNNAVSITNCNTKLEVNGPVFAKKIKLDRTAGADPSTAESAAKYAEKFDVGAASYLWAYNQALNYDQAKTVHLRELAPRY